MTEFSNIENDIKAFEEKIDEWFHKHFISSAPGSETHAAILKAHEELKSIVRITPAADATTETSVNTAIPPVA